MTRPHLRASRAESELSGFARLGFGRSRAASLARQVWLALLSMVLLATLVPSASAQTDEIESARDKREQIRLEQQNLLRSMDPLLSNLEKLEDAIALVELARQEQQVELEVIRERMRFAQDEISRVERAIGQKQVEVEDQRGVVTERAVDAYTTQGDEDLAQILASTDFNQAGRRQAFLQTVSESGADAVDDLRATRAELDDLLAEAQEARADILEAQVAENEKLDEINAAAIELAAAKQNLADRLDREFFAEADLLESSYDAVSQEINALVAAEERRLWELEQARIAEERRREAELLAQQAAASGESSGLVASGQPAPTFNGQFLWPVQGTFTSGFGTRVHPITGQVKTHNGIDVSANTGTAVRSAGNGVVLSAGDSGDGYGKKILVNHGSGLVTLYAHLNSISVNRGQSVTAADTIGTVGSTGFSTGPHLHFEVRVNGVAYNPLNYLP